MIKLAIIGCGAVAAMSYLPALAAMNDVQVTLLVDQDLNRARALAERYGVPQVSADFHDAVDAAQAAIVALPNYLNGPVSLALLQQGRHVQVEKPMAVSTAECDAMIAVAEQRQLVLGVGLMRRFRRSYQLARELINSGALGPIQTFDIQEGAVYGWPLASDFILRRETAGGGVLIDTGSHVLDALLWWLGDVRDVACWDDQAGGVEADCVLELTMASGARGTVTLSRLRNLRNTAIIQGARATLEVELAANALSLIPADSALAMAGQALPREDLTAPEQTTVDLFTAELTDWLSAINSGTRPSIDGREGRRSLALIEAGYARRQPAVCPWQLAATA